jgi:hypothetical protein
MMVGRFAVRAPYGQSGSLRGLELIPSKWRCLVPPRRVEPVETTSPHHPWQGAPQGCYAIPRRGITPAVETVEKVGKYTAPG